MTDFELTDGERMHPLWLRLKAHLNDRLDDFRKRNDANMPEAETAKLRGSIACLKQIIALGDDKPVVEQWR